MLRLLQAIQDIRYSLWFIPTATVAFAIALAILAIEADTHVDGDLLSRWPLIFGASADGARAMLQTVAGAMITVAGLTFSITVLVLSLGASQYTPRVIRTFMGNRATQTVLGVFIGIFVYCLIVLRSVRGSEEAFVPSIAVTVAGLLALLGVGVLVYFIHHMAMSIQASTIASTVASETIQVIDSVFREREQETEREREEDADFCETDVEHWFPVASIHTGYLRRVDLQGLMAYARKHDLVIRMDKEIGEFLIQGSTLVSVSRKPEGHMDRELNHLYATGHYRTVEQDVAVGMRQLVDVALRAMSPAVNDTTSALLCIDFLSAVLARLMPLRIKSEDCEHEGKVLVIRHGPDFDRFLRLALEEILQNANGNIAVYVRLTQALETVGVCEGPVRRKRLIASKIRLVWDYAQRSVHAPDQLAMLEQHRMRAVSRVEQAAAQQHSA